MVLSEEIVNDVCDGAALSLGLFLEQIVDPLGDADRELTISRFLCHGRRIKNCHTSSCVSSVFPTAWRDLASAAL
jgi:hypothetical protein